MCGLAAIFSELEPSHRGALECAISQLSHRGPDNQCVWYSPDRRVGLGHARLSIIDLSGGGQPITNEDRSVHIVVNGEFYDFERQRSELQARGHRFHTGSDSEIALHLYEEFGVHCVHHLRGEFAFVLWDATNQMLVAARDRLGIKPLYYAIHRHTLYLASEIKALFAAGVPARWDTEDFYQHTTGPLMGDRSLFAGVYQIPPGHYLVATGQTHRLVRYWELNYATAATLATTGRSDADYVNDFSTVFDEAVRLRMRADVPVGCYLSGGLDSCAVLGFAARHSHKPIEAFTLTFDQAAYDEGPIAREMAALAHANYHPVPICQADIADHFGDAVWHAETLFRNGHGVSKYLLSRAVLDAGFKVVYTGEGSDEILGGYPHFRSDMLMHNSQGQDAAEVRRLQEQLKAGNAVSNGLLLPAAETSPLNSVERLLGFVPTFMQTFAAAADLQRQMFTDDYRRRFHGRDSMRMFLDGLDIPGVLAGRDPLHKSLYLWTKSLLPCYILTLLGDRMEMAHSIEGRVPFLDHHVVDFLGQVPVPMKIRGMTEKYLLREAAKPVITDTVYRRQKHPFLAPPATVTPTERFHQLLQDTLRGPGLAAVPFYDQKKVIAILDKLPGLAEADRVAWDPALTMVLSSCVLQDRYRLGAH